MAEVPSYVHGSKMAVLFEGERQRSSVCEQFQQVTVGAVKVHVPAALSGIQLAVRRVPGIAPAKLKGVTTSDVKPIKEKTSDPISVI